MRSPQATDYELTRLKERVSLLYKLLICFVLIIFVLQAIILVLITK